MVKLIFLCRRRRDITHAQYTDRLLNGHVPLACRHHPSMRRYVVNVVEDSPPGGEALDSIGELSFDSLDDFRCRLYDSPHGRRIIEKDVAEFMGGVEAYMTTEHAQRTPAGCPSLGIRSPGIKLVCPLVRRADITHHAFVDHWLNTHAPLARAHHPGLRTYVANVVEQRLSDSGPDLDGIAELHFPSADALRRSLFDSTESERLIREDMARFIGSAAAYRVAEYRQR